MNSPMTLALMLAGGLILMGMVTATWQLRGMKRLAVRKHVPSDEWGYLRRRYRRRLWTAGVLLLLGGLIGGAYLSGMEERAANLGKERANAEGEPPEMTAEQKQFVRFWTSFWIVVIILVFVLLALALADSWATRRFWYGQLRQMREEHQAKLRRDLAVHKQAHENARNERLGRFDSEN